MSNDASGKLHAGPVRPFISYGDGEEFTKEEVVADIQLSIRELTRALDEAKKFEANVHADSFGPEGGEYLSFRYVVEHGYERTGPQYVSTKAKDDA